MNELHNRLYQAIGLNQAQIDSRFRQAAMLTKQNGYKSFDKTGGGLQVAYDTMSGTSLAPIIAKDQAEASLIRQAYESLGGRAADDTYAFNIPSSGVPLPLLTIWTTRMIEQLYKTMTLSKLAGSWQQGAPGVQEIKIPTIQFAGQVGIYDDMSMNGGTSINTNWVTRNIAYFEESLVWGDMQQAQYGIAKIDYANKLREAMTITISQFQNDLGFQGYTGIPAADNPHLFGILNEPNLNAAVTLPVDGQVPGTLTPTAAWTGKDFNQLCRDFRLLVGQVLQQAEGHVDLNTKGIMGLPPSAFVALSTPNPLSSVTFIEFLKDAYPNIEIVQVPNFEASMVTTGVTTGQTVVMLLFQHPNGEMPYDELFVTKWQGHRPIPQASSISEKVSFGLGGVILKYPLLVTYAYGV